MKPKASSPTFEKLEPLVVRLTREPFCPWVTLHLPDTSSEDLDVDDAKQWFKDRGADMSVVDKALDHVWNFYGVRRPVLVKINNPKKPKVDTSKMAPRI